MKINVYRIIKDKNNLPSLKVIDSIEYNRKLDNYRLMINILDEHFDFTNTMVESEFVFAFDEDMNCLGITQLSIGDSLECNTNEREMFIFLLLCGSKNFTLFHNHVCGGAYASEKDIRSCGLIQIAAQTLGINLYEDISVDKEQFYLAKKGKLYDR